jgi:hypothetical protein
VLKLLGVYAQGVVAGGAFESIATVTASGGETTLSFTSIPQTYQHLQIRCLAQRSAAQSGIVNFNSDTGSNYAYHSLEGLGSSVSADGTASDTRILIRRFWRGNSTANSFGVAMLDIHDYANTAKYKTLRVFNGNDNNDSSGSVNLQSGLWMSTSAITQIDIGSTGSISAGSTFALYGIKA